MDPYKILGVSYSAELPQIREQFKRLVLKVHPDRGGNPRDFEIVKQAYKYLYEYKTNEKKQLNNEKRNLEQMKNERQKQSKKLKQNYNRISSNNKLKVNGNDGKNFNERQFNRLFTQYKTKDADDRGYEVQKSSKERLDASDIQKNHEAPKKMQIMIIEEPEPIELGTQNYKKLGLKHVKDFSKKHAGKGQQFMDYQEAYTNRDVLENNMGNVRNEYKSISDLKSNRGNINYKMDEQEKQVYNRKMEEEKAMEEKRRFNFHQQRLKAQKNFRKMQNHLTL
jgi:curved DNA-binding protein CbpA